MENKFANNTTAAREQATAINFEALLNCCCREFDNWSRYDGIPRYDPALAGFMTQTGYRSFIRFEFKTSVAEVYAPVKYFSYSGVHHFQFPVFERNLETDAINSIPPQRFVALCAAHATKEYPDADAARTLRLLENSIENLAVSLTAPAMRDAARAALTFIEAEQSLIAGHTVHPIPKCREGWGIEASQQYAPEMKGRFALYYFLIHPDCVVEKNAAEKTATANLYESLAGILPEAAQQLVAKNPGWKLVPVHPWEADYLLEQEPVKAMLEENLLHPLGQFGPEYTATSSVRTVYNPSSAWMFKFSLHIKITNSYRVNYAHELHRGYDAARLLQTTWGELIHKEFPEVQLIADPGFIMVRYKGVVIDGFSTGIRENPFRQAAASKNISLAASFVQAALPGQSSRLLNVIRAAAEATGLPETETAKRWFQQYLDISLKPLSRIFSKYGFGCEFHQQNALIELDAHYFPCKFYFRDNQGYFFRQGMEETITKLVPGFGMESRLFIAEPRISGFWGYYLVLNHILGVAAALGREGLADEAGLISTVYQTLLAQKEKDKSGLIAYLTESNRLTVKCNLLTNLNNMDEASAPRTNPAVYRPIPNPLHYHFFSRRLIRPQKDAIAYRRYFPKAAVEIVIRPMDIERDLELLHEWFHREHALKIWKMNWPLRELEDYYRTLQAGDIGHGYIGYANDVPTFTIEVYWASRDIVGGYYEVLPSDYGTHQFIAPTDPKLKYASPSTQAMVDFVFSEQKVGKMVGEGSVDSLASIMNKAHVGFKIQKVIELPDKKANLNFCYREWYWEKFPEAKAIHEQYLPEEIIKYSLL